MRAMQECGVLAAIFPELREMEALVIRDFYHRYTVDEHTLVAIQTVLDLRGKKGDMFGDLANETDDLDLLTTALLFHDVGKGTPDESHVEVSRRIADARCTASASSERDWGIVSFLIGSHLEMSAAMNGRDLSDPATTPRDGGQNRHRRASEAADAAHLRRYQRRPSLSHDAVAQATAVEAFIRRLTPS